MDTTNSMPRIFGECRVCKNYFFSNLTPFYAELDVWCTASNPLKYNKNAISQRVLQTAFIVNEFSHVCHPLTFPRKPNNEEFLLRQSSVI